RPAGNRRRGDRCARQTCPSGLAAEPQADWGAIEAVGASESREQVDVGAGAAPAIEKACIRPAVDGALEKGDDEGPETAEPEVTRLGARRRAQQMLHARHCIVCVT